RSRLRTSSRRSSGPLAMTVDAAPLVWGIVGIEGFGCGPEIRGNVLKVDADACPSLKAAAHSIDQYVGGRQASRHLGVARLPTGKAGERFFVLPRSADLDQRTRGPTPTRRLHAVGLTGLLSVMRRPRRVPQPVPLLTR